MNDTNKLFWQQEVLHKKQVRKWIRRVLLGFMILLAIAWAMVTQPILPISRNGAKLPDVDSTKLETHVRMLADQIFPRDGMHPENLDRAAGYIRECLTNANGVVTEQVFESRGNTYRNIIACYGPETQERIIVGAHYDAAGRQPGSDDNASGVAGLLELAGVLSHSRLRMRVDLVAYTLEEWFGSKDMGSTVHAQSLRRQKAPVRLMIALEMIGFFSDAPHSQEMPVDIIKPFYPGCGNFIAVVGNLGQGGNVRRIKKAMRAGSDLPVYSLNAPRFLPGVDWSDHMNFWDAGYDAVMITDTAFLRNKNYHRSSDTPDTLDYKRMAMVVQGVYSAVLETANR
jgi:hypothetical protein